MAPIVLASAEPQLSWAQALAEPHRHDRTCYWDVVECRWSCEAPGPDGERDPHPSA